MNCTCDILDESTENCAILSDREEEHGGDDRTIVTETQDQISVATQGDMKVVPETRFAQPQVITEQPDTQDCAIPDKLSEADSEQSNFFIWSIHYPMTTWFTNLDLYFYCSIYVIFTVT